MPVACRRRYRKALLACLLAFALPACEEEQPEIVEAVRAIKTYTVSRVASGQVRTFPGIVQATDSSALSFQVAGNVQEVRVNLGDDVVKGQVLAVLDKKPYELDVEAAEAELKRAEAERQEKKVEFDRQNKLYQKEWVSKAAYDQALAAFQSAESTVSYAVSKLNLAKRDLANTELRAPFDGVVAEKQVDPFVEVAVGQKLFEINAKGALEIAFDVPETTISKVNLGLPVTVTFPTARDLVGNGRVTEVGSVAGSANAFPVKAGLVDPPPSIRSGMTAEVSLILKDEAGKSGYLVPLSAIAPGEEQGRGYVFVFDAASSTVQKRSVAGRGAQDNWVEITGGVAPGDIVAIAGANFLVDGQKVKLMRR